MLSLTKFEARAGLALAILSPAVWACGTAPSERPAVAPQSEPAAQASPSASRATAATQPEPAHIANSLDGKRDPPAERDTPGASMPSPAETIGVTNASLSMEPTAPDAARGVELPSGTTVLHIGDSFAGALGIELNREFKEAGVRGILKYETATYIPTWAWGKDLEKYLSKYHPDLVLITLGANELEIPDPAQRAPTIRHLVERLGGKPCVWVAPPLWHGARPALLDVIRESCAPCAYLDSGELVPELPRARDGIHPAMAARKAWAQAVIKWLGEHRRGDESRPWRIE